MADINEVISKKALKDMLKLEKSVEKTATNIKKVFDASKKLDQQMKKGTGTKELSKDQKELIQNKKTVDQLNKQLITSQTKLNTTYSKTGRELTKNKLAIQQKNKQLKLATQAVHSASGSYDQLNAKLAQNISKYKRLSAEQRNNTAIGGKLRTNIQKQQVELKKLDAGLGNHQRNVGNYGDAMTALPGPIGMVITTMKTLGKVIFASPIGWLIGAIALLAGAVKTFFTNSEEGQDRWNKVAIRGKLLWGNIKDGIADAGEAIVDFISGLKDTEEPLKKFGNSVKEHFGEIKEKVKEFKEDAEEKGFWKAVSDNVTDTYNDIKDGIQGKIDKNKEERAIADDLAARQNKLNKDERKALVDTAKLRRDIAELRAKASDRESIPATERIKLLDQAIERENEILNLNARLAKERLNLLQIENSLSDSTIEDKQKEAEAEKELIDLYTANAEKRRRFINERLIAIRENRALELKEEKENQAFLNELSKEEAAFDKEIEKEAAKESIELEKQITESLAEEAQKRIDIARNEAEEKGIIRQATIDTAIMAGNALFDFTSNLRNAEIQNLEDSKKRGAITEEQYAKKIAEIRRRQAIADKAQALFNIAIGTAVKVVQSPLFLAPFIIAQGAIQAAVVASKPIPKFAKGSEGTPKGFGIFGEAGREMFITPQGETGISPNKSTTAYFQKGTKIIPNKNTEEIIAASQGRLGYDNTDLKNTIENGNNRLIRTIKNKRELTIIPSRRKITERNGNYYKHYFNTKFG